MPMFPNILFSRLTFVKFCKNITNKCKRVGSKQISLLLNSLVHC